MPSRRRPTPISSAAALPASRLPLGTPNLPTPTSQGSATSSSHSPPRLRPPVADPAPGKENWDTTIIASITQSNDSFTMASKPDTDSAPARSIAEAKLERQKKRNEEIEAALTNIVPADKRSHRGKKKQWQPFTIDPLADSTRNTTPSEVRESMCNSVSKTSCNSEISHKLRYVLCAEVETSLSFLDSLPCGTFANSLTCL